MLPLSYAASQPKLPWVGRFEDGKVELIFLKYLSEVSIISSQEENFLIKSTSKLFRSFSLFGFFKLLSYKQKDKKINRTFIKLIVCLIPPRELL